MSLNQILLIGRAGNDPEMRYTPSGTPVTSFSLAVNNNKRDAKGEWTEETEWFRVTAWERTAESVNQYLAKGRRVFVDGGQRDLNHQQHLVIGMGVGRG